MKTNKILALILIAVLALSAINISAFAAQEGGYVTSVTLDKTAVELVPGKTVTLTPTVTYDGLGLGDLVNWSSSATDVATVEDGVVTAVGAGTAIITATSVEYNTTGTAYETATCTVTVLESTFLDLDETSADKDTYPKSKTIDQLYSATVTENKTNVTKVQVSWKLTDIQASVKINKIWDPDTLKWIDDTNNENSVTASDVTAEFDFVNLSSLMIEAKVEFEAATGITAVATYKDNTETTDGDGKIVLDTANTTESTYDNTGKVVVSVPADKDFFKTITEDVTDGTYGTYTVSIGKYVPKTFAFKGFYDETKGNATANGMSASALCQYMLDYDMITDASKFGDVEVVSEYYSKVQGKYVSITRKLSLLFDTASQEFGEGSNTFDTMVGDNDLIPNKSLMDAFKDITFEWNGTAFVKKAK